MSTQKGKIRLQATDVRLEEALKEHLANLRGCRQCPNMIGPVVTHAPVISKIYLVGQAPGPREGGLGRPFAWTAGKTLFAWFKSIGIDEQEFRSLAYMSAVCRCFPGKTKGGGDRVPTEREISQCSQWMQREFEILQPDLVIPIGRLAITRFMGQVHLIDVVGNQYRAAAFGCEFDVIPLPHSSGASSWFKKEPGKFLLQKALKVLSMHPSWVTLCQSAKRTQHMEDIAADFDS